MRAFNFTRSSLKVIRNLLAIAAIAIAVPATVLAQEGVESELTVQDVREVFLDDIHPGPGGANLLELQIRALTEFGEPVERLKASEIVVLQDGMALEEGLETTPLEHADVGVTAVLVLDVSPTMKDVFEDSQAAAIELLDRLGEQDQLAIVSFTGEVRIVAPFGVERAEARQRLENLEVDEDTAPTALFDAIYEAVRLVRRGEKLPRKSLVIVLSDGIDGGTSSSDIDQIVAASDGTGSEPSVLIYAIGYRRLGGSGLGNLRELASRTGGDYMEDLTKSYQDIWDQTDWSHLVRVQTPMDGRSHAITVKINGRAASRTVTFPGQGPPIWYYVAPTTAVLLIVAIIIAARRRRPERYLTIETGGLAGERHPLRSGTTKIGRSISNDLVLESINVSARHAELSLEGQVAELRDTGSTNGTFVNGVEIKASCSLEPGDQIRLGDVELTFS